jgi:hypothetical protein
VVTDTTDDPQGCQRRWLAGRQLVAYIVAGGVGLNQQWTRTAAGQRTVYSGGSQRCLMPKPTAPVTAPR